MLCPAFIAVHFVIYNNKIDIRFYNYLFTKDKDNIVYLDRNPYIIYVSKENNNSWGMTIKRERGS